MEYAASPVSAQFCPPPNTSKDLPNGDLQKRLCYATSRGRMDFKKIF